MRLSFVISLCLLYLLPGISLGQTCTNLGQNPTTAFPVCGTSVFTQNNVPICGNRSVPGPCSSDGLTDKNPFWYKFTCFTSGTLGFVITPNTLSDDYDWQLFDVTGKNVATVFTDASLVVSCNWSGEGGVTGASAAGRDLFVCAGAGKALFSSMVNLVKDHEYLLLVSHFTNSQSGYKLEFKGGTANITDPTAPAFKVAEPSCDGTQIKVKLNKKMRCSSLKDDGSDFTISPANGKVVKAVAAGCTSGFDMDSVVLTIDNPLPAGDYFVVAQNGSDGNTILDNCNTGLAVDSRMGFRVAPVSPTRMDSLAPVGCAPSSLKLVFSKPMLCSSVATDGSDFVLTGAGNVSVTGASGSCSADGKSRIITVNLSAPLVSAGFYTITLRNGTDNNTLLNDCGQQTPAGDAIQFNTADTVSAGFTYTVFPGCASDQVLFTHDGRNAVNSWLWTFDSRFTNTSQDVSMTYTSGGIHSSKLLVSNGVCADSLTLDIDLGEKVKAVFAAPDIICPGEMAVFQDNSRGPVVSWEWDFGNGTRSSGSQPAPQTYPAVNRDVLQTVTLVVKDAQGCTDTTNRKFQTVSSCMIAVPNAFTPNGDGRNDYLFPSNAYKAADLLFRVYNRFGQLVFESRDWNRRWDGTFKSKALEQGTYVWVLSYVDKDTGKKFFGKGSTVLLR